jgi:hypothetical protein
MATPTPTVSRTELASELGLSPNRVSELLKLGVFVRDEKGRYDRSNISKYRSYLEQYLKQRYNQEKECIVSATAQLVRARAEQKQLEFHKLITSLIYCEVARDYLDYVRNVVPAIVHAMVDQLAPVLADLDDTNRVGLEINDAVYNALLQCRDAVDYEQFVLDHPEHHAEEQEPVIVWINSGCAKTDLDEARLAKVQWLTDYENLVTGLMRGEYHYNDVFVEYVGAAFTTVKSRLEGLSNRCANILASVSDAQSVRGALTEYVEECLAELPVYDPERLKAKEYITSTVKAPDQAALEEQEEEEESIDEA